MTIKDTLVACVRSVLGAETDVIWADREAAWRDNGLVVRLRVLSVTGVGVPERRYVSDEGGLPAELPYELPLEINVREFVRQDRTLRVQVEIETDDQDFEESSTEMAERLALGFCSAAVEDLLAAEDLGWPRSSGPLYTGAPDAHRDQRSVTVFELWFPWVRVHDAGLIDTVREVEITSDVTDTITVVG